MTSWQHDPRTTIGGSPTFVCPPSPKDSLSMRTLLDVGFGVVTVKVDDEVRWQKYRSQRRMASVEREARREPERRWTVTFLGALSGAVYERRGRDEWVIAERLEGFA